MTGMPDAGVVGSRGGGWGHVRPSTVKTGLVRTLNLRQQQSLLKLITLHPPKPCPYTPQNNSKAQPEPKLFSIKP